MENLNIQKELTLQKNKLHSVTESAKYVRCGWKMFVAADCWSKPSVGLDI